MKLMVTINSVAREVFEKISARVDMDSEFYSDITVEYYGSNLYGDLTIRSEDATKFKKVLSIICDSLES